MRRRPSDVWRMNAARSLRADGRGHLGDERRGDRHRQQAVGEDEEREGVEVGGGVAGAGVGEVAHDDDGDLVGDDVAERPPRQRQQPAHGGVAEVEPGRKRDAGPPDGGISTSAIAAMPAVAPSPSVQRRRSFVEHVAQRPLPLAGGRAATAG